MSTSTNTPQWDKLKESMNVEDHPSKKSSELIHREPFQGPVELIGLQPEGEKEKWFAAMGKRRLTDHYETKELLLEAMAINHWSFMTSIIAAIVDEALDARKQDTIQQLREYYKAAREMENNTDSSPHTNH